MFWAPRATALPASASRTAASAGKGGHTSTSTPGGVPIDSRRREASFAASAIVPCIFQFPAISGVRMGTGQYTFAPEGVNAYRGGERPGRHAEGLTGASPPPMISNEGGFMRYVALLTALAAASAARAQDVQDLKVGDRVRVTLKNKNEIIGLVKLPARLSPRQLLEIKNPQAFDLSEEDSITLDLSLDNPRLG